MKTGLYVCGGLSVLGVLLGLVQLWFCPWTPEVFLKIEISVGALLPIVGVTCFVLKEVRDGKAMRRGDLDG